MKRKSLTITVSKTVQVKQYEPVTITLTDIVELESDDDPKDVRNRVYKELTKSLVVYLNHEIKQYAET